MAETDTLRHSQIKLAPVVLFLIGEPVLSDKAVSRLIGRALERNLATVVTKIDAEQYTVGQLIITAGPPLFAEPNAVAASDLQKVSDAFFTDALVYVFASDPDIVFILRHDGRARERRLLNAMRADDFQCCEILTVKHPNERAAPVRNEASRARRHITADAVEALIDAHGNDIGELVVTTSQLLPDANRTIDEAITRTYYAGRIRTGGFDITDATVTDNGDGVMAFIRHALVSGVAPVPITTVLVYKLHTLALVAVRKDASARLDDPTMSPGQCRRAERIAEQWLNEASATVIQTVAQTDTEVKGASRDPEFAPECITLWIAAVRGG